MTIYTGSNRRGTEFTFEPSWASVSLRHNAHYRKKSIAAARYGFGAIHVIRSIWRLTSISTVVLPRRLSNSRAIEEFNNKYHGSEIIRWEVLPLNESGPQFGGMDCVCDGQANSSGIWCINRSFSRRWSRYFFSAWTHLPLVPHICVSGNSLSPI